MTSLTFRTVLTENSFSSPELKQFLGEEKEIIVRKIPKDKSTSLQDRIHKVQETVKKYNNGNLKLSKELIRERQEEASDE